MLCFRIVAEEYIGLRLGGLDAAYLDTVSCPEGIDPFYKFSDVDKSKLIIILGYVEYDDVQ